MLGDWNNRIHNTEDRSQNEITRLRLQLCRAKKVGARWRFVKAGRLNQVSVRKREGVQIFP
jgi:hypothetical protein